jgi:glycerol kinase
VAGAYPLALWQLADGARAFCVEGTVITAGAAVDQWVELGLAHDAAELSRLAASTEGAKGVRFVPALQGLGTPFMDDGARGALLGMSRGATRAELARAVLDGIAQRCADVCEALPLGPGALRVDGGLAQSDPLVQSLADLAAREIARAAEVETTGLGAAFLAGLATGVFASPEACGRLAAPGKSFAPRLAEDARRAEREAWREALAHAKTRA